MKKPVARLLVVSAALAACAHPGGADALTLAVGAPSVVGLGMVRVPVTLTNGGRRPNERVAVTCSFFDDADQPIATSRVYFRGVAPGASQSEVFLLQPDARVSSHDCKVAPPR